MAGGISDHIWTRACGRMIYGGPVSNFHHHRLIKPSPTGYWALYLYLSGLARFHAPLPDRPIYEEDFANANKNWKKAIGSTIAGSDMSRFEFSSTTI